METPEPIAARHLPFVRTMWLGLWAVAVAGFLALFYLGLVLASAPVTVLGFLAAMGAAYYLIQSWNEYRTIEDVVTVNAEGFHDRRLGPAIPWRDITGLTRHAPGTRVFLFIAADRPERFLDKRGRIRRAYDAANRRRGFPPLTSDLSGLTEPGDAILQTAEKFHTAAQSH